MQSFFKAVIDWFISVWNTADQVARGKAVVTIEIELEELEHVFGLLVLGSFVALPAPPMQISLDLIPFMEKELILMTEKIDTANQPLSQLFSSFDIG